jgi:hypothetical protein
VSRSRGPRAELSQDCYYHLCRFPRSTSHAMSAFADPSSKPAHPTVCKAAVNSFCIAGHVCRCPPISNWEHHKGCTIPFRCAALVARRSACGWQLQQWVWLAVLWRLGSRLCCESLQQSPLRGCGVQHLAPTPVTESATVCHALQCVALC